MLYKRGNTWWIKFKTKGETIRRSAGTASKRKAQEVERALRDQVARNIHAGRTGKPVTYTYEDALLKWIQSGAPKSMWSHARNTRPYLDSSPLHLVVPAAHAMKADMLRKKLSPQTINRRLAVVRRVLNVAYREWDWISEPLGQKIQLLSEKGMAREFYLSRAEVNLLIASVKSKTARNVITLAAFTGLRKSELLGLTVKNWQKPYIVLNNKTKAGKPRTIPVIEEVQECVMLPFDITEQQLREEFEAARELIQRPDVRFHDLRHTYASWLAKDPKVPLTTLRDLLGHSNLSVTSKYAHLRGDTMGLVTDALNGTLH